ncbi:MAG: hypothetical protein AB8C84_01575 [Oligoflexales bacterium]
MNGLYTFLFLGLLAVSAKTKDLITLEGKLFIQGPPHHSEISLKTHDKQKIPICNTEKSDQLRRLSGFIISIIGVLDPLQEDCLLMEKTHILRFPYGAPAIVGRFLNTSLKQSIFQDTQGQEYKFSRIPFSLINEEDLVILTIVPDDPLQPQNGNWKIVTYSEYPLTD